ncbi:hypothetical protein MY5147_009826 [Beauveria neobassiana]
MPTTLIIQEGTQDLKDLAKNHYNLQVAKAVSAPGGTARFNVVYASKSLAPNMSVEWGANYGINWTTEVPNPGATVTYTGRWQACKLGESYDLTETGGWEINNNDPHKDNSSVNVGKNGYTKPIHVIMFVSPDSLPHSGYGQYQPRDVVQLWFGEGIITETMISTQSTAVQDFDMTRIPKQYFWYSYGTGSWQHSSHPFDPPKAKEPALHRGMGITV